MDVIIPDEVQRSPRLMAASDRIKKFLEAALSDSVTDDPVAAEFGVFHEPGGRAGLDLAIADQTGTASTRFSSGTLSDDDYLKRQVRDLWGDLLSKRSRVYMSRLREHLAALPSGD